MAAFTSIRRTWRRLKLAERFADSVRPPRQLAYYRHPAEQRICPACGSLDLRHLEPLPITRAGAKYWRFWFITGCRACGVLFANPQPPAAEIAAEYTPEGEWGRERQDVSEAQVSTARLARVFAPMAAELDVLNPPPGAAVLDFGCGLGGLLDTLADRGWVTFGLDPATSVAFRRHTEVTMLPDAPTFDLVVLHHVLEHVTAPLEILDRLARATKIGGWLLISVPNVDTLPEHGELEYCLRATTHVMAYSSACLSWLMGRAGFQLVGEPRDEGPNHRRRVVLAKRVAGAAVSPTTPLEAAQRALAAHRQTRPDPYPGALWFPVRVRAALANRQRLQRGAQA